MLDKIKSFFGMDQRDDLKDEKNESPHPVKRNLSDRGIETKVTYEYPRSTPFRFPVIPDEKPIQRNFHDRMNKNNRTEDHDEHHQAKMVREQEMQMSTPFIPSKVASPIYGYNRRKDDEVHHLPAYIRRRNKKNNHIQHHEYDLSIEEQVTEYKDIPNEQKTINANQKQKKHQRENNFHKTEKTKPNKPIPEFNMVHPNPTDPIKDEQEVMPESEQFIPLHLLNEPIETTSGDRKWTENQQKLLEQTLTHFNVKAKVVHATQGPTVTRFEVQPELGVKVSRVRNLSDDIKMNMAARDIRIEAPIPGKNTIGIEVPNEKAQTVGLQEIIDTEQFRNNESPLAIGLGLSIEGVPHITTIDQMPHGLIAGATGSGKSVCINTILMSLLYKSSHEDVKLLLIDPKMVELAPYNDIPHLVAPVITDVKAATAALKWAVEEMEDRYERFVQASVRDIQRFNQKAIENDEDQMPHIVIIIDELSDLMMASPQDVEDAICRIAQKARACGMHLIVATQRPSVDVITGLIKANIPTRIAFSVSSQVDSRTIIDTNGAERLLGNGDMLFLENGSGKSVRLQGAFVSDEEIERITDYVKSFAQPNYLFHQEELLKQIEIDEEVDELFEDVIQFILEHNQASTSLLQRHFRIGYNRAARLIDTLEAKGMISEQRGSKPRNVLFTIDELDEFI